MGCPIPIMYDEDQKPHKVPEIYYLLFCLRLKELEPTGNPLDKDQNWKTIEINGKKFFRETDTLDTFVIHRGIF